MSSSNRPDCQVRLALPSKGSLEEGTHELLKACGLRVHKTNPRQYIAYIPALPSVSVVFQRVADIATLVQQGNADLGITGLDLVAEAKGGLDDLDTGSRDELMVLAPDLGFGRCQLVLAVPETWIDVESCHDLANVSLFYRERKERNLRIATKYPELTRQFLFTKGLSYFSTVSAHGALEAAPTTGTADMISDLTASGTTLRENRLKILNDGIILQSQGCLIGNRRALIERPEVMAVTRTILEMIEAHIRSRRFYTVTANIAGPNAETIAAQLNSRADLSGLQGPTVASVYARDEHTAGVDGEGNQLEWFAITLVIEARRLLDVVNHLREAGSASVSVTPVNYVFYRDSEMVKDVERRLK